MEYITLLLVAANTGLGIYALTRINALYVELRTPIVKKLSSDMNLKPSSSRRPVGAQEMAARQGNNGRDNRNNGGNNANPNKDRQKDNRGDRRDVQQPVAVQQPAVQAEAPRENRENRDRDGRNRDGRDRDGRNRDGRDRDGRNRDGRDRDGRNRDGRGDRARRPQEMMSNDNGSEVASFEATEAPVQERIVSEGRPSIEGRRPLEPRFQPEVAVAESAVESSAAVIVDATDAAPEFDPSKMRHGRRSMVKKAPAFEDDTPAEG